MAAWRWAIELSLEEADMAELKAIAQSRSEPASRVERARIEDESIAGSPSSGAPQKVVIEDMRTPVPGYRSNKSSSQLASSLRALPPEVKVEETTSCPK